VTWILRISSRIFSRFDLWTQVVFALSQIRPSTRLGENFRLRFAYACLMGRDRPRIRRAFAGMLRRDLDISATHNLWLAFTAGCLGCQNLAVLIFKKTAARNRGTAEAVIAEREAMFVASLVNGSLAQQLANMLYPICSAPSTDEPVIVVPFGGQYSPLFQLWKQQLDRHAKGRLVVLAMDEQAREIAQEYGACDIVDLSPYFGFDAAGRVEDFSKRHLWVLRVLVLNEMISRGQTVISLDLDAVLVGDLEPMLQSMPDADIVAQRDYSIPVDVARKLGFVLCCGFMRIRSNPATIRFMHSYATQAILEMDDQTSLNHLLVEAGVQNFISTNSHITFDSAGISWACPDTSRVSGDVSYGTVIRHFHPQGQSIGELKKRLGCGDTAGI
jgi:hypothetical protein